MNSMGFSSKAYNCVSSSSRTLKSLYVVVAVLSIAIATLLACAMPSPAQAASYKNGNASSPAQVGGYGYLAEWTGNQGSDNLYNIVAYSPTGQWNRKAIVRDVDEQFVVNDKYLFYAKHKGSPNAYGLYKQTIYRMNLKTGKSKKIASGLDWVPFACSGKYLYCGGKFSSVNEGTLYVYKASSGKKVKKLGKHLTEATYSNGRVLAIKARMQVGNYPIYSFAKNGKGKKTIAKGMYFKVKGKKVYYEEYRKGSNGTSEYRVCSCTVKGTSKKALSGWTTNYREIDNY